MDNRIHKQYKYTLDVPIYNICSLYLHEFTWPTTSPTRHLSSRQLISLQHFNLCELSLDTSSSCHMTCYENYLDQGRCQGQGLPRRRSVPDRWPASFSPVWWWTSVPDHPLPDSLSRSTRSVKLAWTKVSGTASKLYKPT